MQGTRQLSTSLSLDRAPSLPVSCGCGGASLYVFTRTFRVQLLHYSHTLFILFWLQDKKLYDPASHRLFRPLRFRTPYPTMEGLIVSISIYADRERRLIMKLAELLGATTMQTLEPKVAFLICPRPEGSKYAAALKWGIHVVTSQWLYDSATKVGLVLHAVTLAAVVTSLCCCW